MTPNSGRSKVNVMWACAAGAGEGGRDCFTAIDREGDGFFR